MNVGRFVLLTVSRYTSDLRSEGPAEAHSDRMRVVSWVCVVSFFFSM